MICQIVSHPHLDNSWQTLTLFVRWEKHNSYDISVLVQSLVVHDVFEPEILLLISSSWGKSEASSVGRWWLKEVRNVRREQKTKNTKRPPLVSCKFSKTMPVIWRFESVGFEVEWKWDLILAATHVTGLYAFIVRPWFAFWRILLNM